jgi:hypothetical protein
MGNQPNLIKIQQNLIMNMMLIMKDENLLPSSKHLHEEKHYQYIISNSVIPDIFGKWEY